MLMKNSVDPNQKPADLDLHSFQKRVRSLKNLFAHIYIRLNTVLER